MSSGAGWSARVRELFAAPPNAGPLPPGPGEIRVGEAAALERGAWVRIETRVEAGQVTAARFRAWGCPHLIAAAALATSRLEGRPLPGPGITTAAGLAAELQVPPEKLGRLLVLEDALRALAAPPAASR